ncbi:hypothetical protein [Lysobacter sp. CA199]|uniref:hypothetical protein n=1 Tax=Lysobacter sp. CA199 TaxID=3455608 RepID=UPI003F8D7BA2
MNPSSSPSSSDVSGGRSARVPSLSRSLSYAARIAFVVSLVVAFTVLKPDTFAKSEGPPRAATATEQRAILIAVVEDLQPVWQATSGAADAARRRLVMEDATVAVCAMPRQSSDPCVELLPDSTDHLARSLSAPKALVDALSHFNAKPQALDIRTLPDIIAVDRERLAAVFKKGDWPEFHRTYPQASGILSVSRPVISARGDQALLYVAHVYGNLGGRGWVALVELRQGQWKIFGRVELWIS